MEPAVDEPFIIGTFSGPGKPADPNAFLRHFVNDVKNIENKTLLVNGKHITVKINAIICDAPALAYVKKIKYFNGHFGFFRCNQKGKSVLNRMTFPRTNSTLRNDNSFRKKTQKKHHSGKSILEDLQIDMVIQFPIDFMHCVCLGVMKKLLKIWVYGKAAFRLSSDNIISLSIMLIHLRYL